MESAHQPSSKVSQFRVIIHEVRHDRYLVMLAHSEAVV